MIVVSRGNCYASIGEYKTALDDFERSADVFRKIRSISGTIYALSNAALMHAQLGDDDRAIKVY
jgi:tetratricopeptide (TPR) repeat protein